MSLKEDISRILGPEKVSGAPDVLAAHAGDKWYASVLPEAVVFPESTEDVSLLLRYASSMNIPVTARGGGIRRRVRSRARRHQPFPGTDEPYPGDIPGRRRCRGGTRSYHSGSPAGSSCSGMVLPAGPGLQKGMQHRRKHRHERRRPQMPEIWSHQSLRAGADRGACQRRGSGMRRTHP